MSDAPEAYAQKLWDYVHMVENVNFELAGALKQCIKLLEGFADYVHDPVGWEDMLEYFRNTCELAAKTNISDTVH